MILRCAGRGTARGQGNSNPDGVLTSARVATNNEKDAPQVPWCPMRVASTPAASQLTLSEMSP
eukprot:9650452-Alexandrium_andersonii.AAC.1